MPSGVQSWDCAIKGPKEVYISKASVKEARLHTNCYFMSYNSLVQQSASIYSYPLMSTHTYMYSSTDTNMEAHALDMHKCHTCSVAVLEVLIDKSKLHRRADYIHYGILCSLSDHEQRSKTQYFFSVLHTCGQP